MSILFEFAEFCEQIGTKFLVQTAAVVMVDRMVPVSFRMAVLFLVLNQPYRLFRWCLHDSCLEVTA